MSKTRSPTSRPHMLQCCCSQASRSSRSQRYPRFPQHPCRLALLFTLTTILWFTLLATKHTRAQPSSPLSTCSLLPKSLSPTHTDDRSPHNKDMTSQLQAAVPEHMSAVVVREFGGPEKLLVEIDVAVPVDQMGEDDVLVRIHAFGVNPVETYIREGRYARLPTLPFTPGNEGAGIVVATGKNVDHVAVGDRVYVTASTTGTYAQFSVCPGAAVRHLPEPITFQQGAGISTAYRTAYRALFQRASPLPGQVVLVHGASGGVGLAAIQLAVARGLTVYGTAGSEKGMELALQHGATKMFNHRNEAYITEITDSLQDDGKVLALIVEMLANVNLANDLELIGRGGTISIVGNRGDITINPRALMLKESNVVGVLGGTAEEWEQAYAAIDAGLKTGSLSPAVGQAFKLDGIQLAHVEVIEHKHGSSGKIIVEID